MDLWQLASARTMSSCADDAVADDLVRGRRAAEDVEGPVGAEDAGGVAFGLARRPEVVEPRAKRRGGDAEVRAHDVFAEELVELHADGCFRKATPPMWPGASQE
jgi:hypothetical protein